MKIVEIRENHTFYEIITNHDSGVNNGQKIYLIVPTPHKSTIAHLMMSSDLDTDNAYIVLLVISRPEISTYFQIAIKNVQNVFSVSRRTF